MRPRGNFTNEKQDVTCQPTVYGTGCTAARWLARVYSLHQAHVILKRPRARAGITKTRVCVQRLLFDKFAVLQLW